jgi:hypothetical protein
MESKNGRQCGHVTANDRLKRSTRWFPRSSLLLIKPDKPDKSHVIQ